MRRALPITTLFLDIGGVLLTDGWDHRARRRAAAAFKLDRAAFEARHQLVFETYEEGRLTLEEYLALAIFYEKRAFSRAQFRRFMFAQSKPRSDMLTLVTQLKARYGLKIVAVSNEARELNAHRIRTFRLGAIVDAFVSSCFFRIRKPAADMFRIALDLAQTPLRQVVYVENTAMFVQIAEQMGIRSIHHTEFGSTRASLSALGLRSDEGTGA